MTWAWSSAAPGVTHHGTDTHREDPLADLNLSIDGQRTAYQALRGSADTVTGGTWLALGGGGYLPGPAARPGPAASMD